MDQSGEALERAIVLALGGLSGYRSNCSTSSEQMIRAGVRSSDL